MTIPLALLSADHATFTTWRHEFLTSMQQLLPLATLVAHSCCVVESGRGWLRVDLALKPRLHCL